MGKVKDLKNKQFGRLLVIEDTKLSKHNSRVWLCKCDCGNMCEVTSKNLCMGNTKSCGCLNTETRKRLGESNKQFNKYHLTGEYGIGYTNKGEEFYFDLEDYDKIKDCCWHISKGYVRGGNVESKKQVLMHKIIVTTKGTIDHINHNRNDCKKDNLRIITHHQNTMYGSLKRNNSSGIIGVHWDKRAKMWYANIKYNYKQIYLGCFKDKDDAIKARLNGEKKYFKEYSPQQHLFEEYGIGFDKED